MKYDNWDAKEYEKASNMQYRQAIEAINRCHFSGNESILDVGCGDGKITHHLAMLVPNGKVIGCDLTEDMVNFASKKYKEVKNLSFVQESADQINYKEEFDYIVSFSCLHWVIDQVSVWRLFKQALKPNGKVIVGFQVDHEYFWDCVALYMKKDKWKRHFQGFYDPFNHFTLEKMRGFIRSSGLFLKRIDEIYHVEVFEEFDVIKAFFISWVPQFRYLQGPLRDEFATEVLNDYFTQVETFLKDNKGVRIKRFIIEVDKV